VKSRTEVRRQAILDAAAAEFQRNGFERTSMDHVAARAQCSKVTLYSYFESKEQLFYEAIVAAIDREFIDLFGMLKDSTDPVNEALLSFGERFVFLVASPRVRSLRCLIMSASVHGDSDLSRRCFAAGPEPVKKVCAAYLSRAHERGELRVPDPKLAGQQLLALLESEWLDGLFYRVGPKLTKQGARDSAARAVYAFCSMYHASSAPSD
jgi:AcrR family transcriptional regulator